MKATGLWILAFILVAFAAVYQRMTGPTYPVRGHIGLGAGDVRFSLPRSSDSAGDAEIKLDIPDNAVTGTIEFRRFKSNDPITHMELMRQGNELVALLPHQPPAGKVAYRVFLNSGSQPVPLTSDPVVLRFKGDVPAYVMIPHIILMFLAMLFSTRAGIEAMLKRPGTYSLALWTVVTLAIGGLVLGPVVQKYAFGAYWTGWPFGKDLTDNKTVVSFVAWAIALWRLRKKPYSIGWAIAASAILFAIYMIPHSVLGSELDYSGSPGQ